MGELVRRLDYERRSRQRSLLNNTLGGQRIKKEYSNTVRAANAIEERRGDLQVENLERHRRLFLDRYAYEKKVMSKFKSELDSKTRDFNEEKYQQLRRASSAKGRLQSTSQDTDIGTVSELVPRHLYRRKSAAAVTFSFSEDIGENKEANEDEKLEQQVTFNLNEVFEEKLEALAGQNCINWSTVWKRSDISSRLQRRLSYATFIADAENPINIANNMRQQSEQTGVHTAYIPPDISSIKKSRTPSTIQKSSVIPLRPKSATQANIYKQPILNKSSYRPSQSASKVRARSSTNCNPMSRRGSVSSLASSCSQAGSSSGEELENKSRSFRHLREAFKKVKVEKPDAKLNKLTLVKLNHLHKIEHLHESTLKRFEELFTEDLFDLDYAKLCT
ncbi:uncharacterized protein LOC127864462 [Dreissena polymorpha]|uniref:Uncharacterized protein n=1 Tax=Dreissena polymorpha TaxID=45954 RepID=A0A9D4MUI2_DREPO|nr:uncharacterized protein LOC127864462 [Dreissena polymorpha]KAH3882756.1 hypothetical protein DPMN_006701 [Dreissena polymorpha]